MNPILYFFPFIGALAGWMLHWLIIHNLLPATKRMIVQNTGKWVGKHPLRPFRLEEKLRDPVHFENVRPLIEQHVDEFLRVKLSRKMPVVSAFIGDKTINTMRDVLMEELQAIFPQVIGSFAGSLEKQLDIEKLVMDKLNAISDREWREMLREKFGPQLAQFRRMGALTGFILGNLFLLILLLVK